MHILHWSEICPAGEAMHVSYVERPADASWRSHGHDFCEVFWVDSGKGTHIVGELAKPMPLRAGQLVFIRASDVHGFRAEASTEPFALINVAFSRKAWNELRHRYALGEHPAFTEEAPDPPVQELAGEAHADISRLFGELLHERRSAMVRDGFLLSLARKLEGVAPLPGIASAPAWLRRGLIGSLREPDALRRGAAGLAALAGCSTGHLARTMRATLGITPSEWTLEVRLKRAAQLLESTGFSISDVALESGFENLSHFHRCFRRIHNCTPLRYRKERARRVI